MTTRISSPLLVSLCLMLSVLCQAQNEAHCNLRLKESVIDNSELGVIKHITKGEFIFRKMKDWRILHFTNEDASFIVDFFLEESQVIACQTHSVDKKVKIFALRGEDMEEFPFKKHLNELQEKGYFLTSFHKSDDIVVFPLGNCDSAISIHDFEEDMAIYMECPPCGQVLVKDRMEMEDDGDLLRANDFRSYEEEEGLMNMNDMNLPIENGNVKISQPIFEEEKRTIDNSLTEKFEKEKDAMTAEEAMKLEIMQLNQDRALEEAKDTAIEEEAMKLEIIQLNQDRALQEAKDTAIEEDAMTTEEAMKLEIIQLNQDRALQEAKDTVIEEDAMTTKEAVKLKIMQLNQNRTLQEAKDTVIEEDAMTPEEAMKLEITKLSQEQMPIINLEMEEKSDKEPKNKTEKKKENPKKE